MIDGFDVRVVDGVAVQAFLRCEACGLVFDDPTVRSAAMNRHWLAEHGEPPPRLDLIFRDDQGVVYRNANRGR